MKIAIPFFTSLALLLITNFSYAQGWERDYPSFNTGFHYVLSLPDGRIATNDNNNVYLMDGLGNLLHSLPTVPDTTVSGGVFANNLVQLPDGSITGMRSIGNVALIYNIDPDSGTFNWQTTAVLPATTDTYYAPKEIIPVGDSCYYIFANWIQTATDGNTLQRPGLIKTDSLGNVLWAREYPNLADPSNNPRPSSMALHPDGGFVILGSSLTGGYLLRVGLNGDVISNRPIQSFVSGQFLLPNEILPQPDGSYLIGGHLNNNGMEAVLYRVEADGTLAWSTLLGGGATLSYDLSQNADGTIYVLANRFDGTSAIVLNAVLPDGSLLWWSDYPYPFYQQGQNFDRTPDGGFIICGQIRIYNENSGTNDLRGYLLRLGSQGQLYNSQVEGAVFDDLDEDCGPLVEAPLPGWLVAFEGADTLYAITDSMGQYVRRLGAGAYLPRAIPPSPYWESCPPALLSVPDFDTLTYQFPVQAAVECPSLQVDISAPFLRRCFDSRYTLYYCNTGTIPATDAYAEVELDPSLHFLSATLPVSSQQENTYTFQLGDVDVGACGQFYLDVNVDCDMAVLGQTHCTTAHIFPDSICITPPGWSGASMEVEGSCVGDSVEFIIQNVGTAPSFNDLDYLVIEDQVILLQGQYGLDVGESKRIAVAASGGTFRLEAEQEPNHPGNSMPAVTVEGCYPPDGNNISLGYHTQYWEDDGDPFLSIDCQENIGSYDPNDKKAYPKGYGDDHLIEPNQEIEYHIRFQNTGTDTAFTVVISDPLSPFLDITTVKPGASSHPYTFQLSGRRQLEFRFDNILLPDSTTNEPASHGFIKFKVQQLPDLPDGTKIDNSAAIYFDFNDPIITNTFRHRIGRGFIPIALIPDDDNPNAPISLQVAPNPLSENASMELQGYKDSAPIRMEIYDSLGRLARRDQYEEATFTFRRHALPAGIYYYQLSSGGRRLDSGKLIIQ